MAIEQPRIGGQPDGVGLRHDAPLRHEQAAGELSGNGHRSLNQQQGKAGSPR